MSSKARMPFLIKHWASADRSEANNTRVELSTESMTIGVRGRWLTIDFVIFENHGFEVLYSFFFNCVNGDKSSDVSFEEGIAHSN